MTDLVELADLASLYRRFEWAERAACADRPDLNRFPAKGESVREQVAVCQSCPVLSECRDHAYSHPEPVGIWGGEPNRVRRANIAADRRERGVALLRPINHGTTGGYRTHLRRGEAPCESCRDAERLYRAESQERREARA